MKKDNSKVKSNVILNLFQDLKTRCRNGFGKTTTFDFLLEILTFAFLLLTFNLSSAAATDMESSRYQLKYGNIHIGAVEPTSANNKLSTTVGQTAANIFSQGGYIIKAGFQYWHSIIPFSFSVSNTNINLSTLVPNVFSTISDSTKTNLTVSFGAAGEYQVTAIEETQLQTMTGQKIPDTKCDGGDADPCTASLAKTWTSTSSYGFGYNMSSNDIPTDFSTSDHYRPFPNLAGSGTPAVVMSNIDAGKNRTSTMTFKANISSLQEAGNYHTIISFVATPGY